MEIRPAVVKYCGYHRERQSVLGGGIYFSSVSEEMLCASMLCQVIATLCKYLCACVWILTYCSPEGSGQVTALKTLRNIQNTFKEEV